MQKSKHLKKEIDKLVCKLRYLAKEEIKIMGQYPSLPLSDRRGEKAITPQDISHESVRRNEHLSNIFYDLNLMEREGSAYDKVYEMLVGCNAI